MKAAIFFTLILLLNQGVGYTHIPYAQNLLVPTIVRLALNIFLVFLALYYFLSSIKIQIKNSIVPESKKIVYPRKLDLDFSSDSSTYDFNLSFSKLGDVIQYNIISNNVVLSKRLITEFVSLPADIFNINGGHTKTDKDVSRTNIGIIEQRNTIRKIGEVFSSPCIHDLIRADDTSLKFLIRKYVQDCGTITSLGYTKIEDPLDFIGQFLFENAYHRVFGKSIIYKKAFQDYLEHISLASFLVEYSSYNPVQLLRGLFSKRRNLIITKNLSKLIEAELKKTDQKSKHFFSDASAVRMLKNHYVPGTKEDIETTTVVLQRIFRGMVTILPSRVLNILVDISVEHDLYFNLVQEQKEIVGVYGDKISMPAAMQMKYLDAFIKESLQLSSPGSFMHRLSAKSVVLSDGTTIKKGSLVSINLFSKHHTFEESEKKYRSFDPSQHLLNQSDKNDLIGDNLVWGHGQRACPFSKYALAQLKTIIAFFLRNYQIYIDQQTVELGHPGYQYASTVAPKIDCIYLKKHEI